METIFKKPLILSGADDNVVLVYSKYIIGNIKKEIADLSIEGIDKDLLNLTRFESLVKIKEVFKYNYNPGSDSHITFGIKNVSGISYKKIDFKDPETTRQAEISLQIRFEKLGFKRTEKKLSPVKTAILPISMIIMVVALGGECTWCHYVQDIGYIPFMVLMAILLTACSVWLIKRILNPSYQVSAVK